MARLIVLQMLLVLAAHEAHSEPQNEKLPTPKEIVAILQSGDGTAKELIAKRLGFAENRGELISADLEFDSITLNHVVLETPGPHVVIHATCTSCWRGYIAVLEPSGNDRWRHLDTVVVGGKHRKPKVSVRNIVGAAESEIVIQENEVFTGTGMWQYNLSILKLHAGRLEAIFDEPEEVNFAVPFTGDKGFYNTEQTQKSEFLFSTPSDGNSHPLLIYEKQIIKVHDQAVSRWRVFYWDANLCRYVHNPIARPDTPLGALRPIP